MDVKIGILRLLERLSNSEEGGWAVADIIKFLEKNKIKKSKKELLALLKDMENEGLIEKRHFANGNEDYTIENKGIKFLKGAGDCKWLIP
jgi:DNA-binding PadR family transcriptional regulator